MTRPSAPSDSPRSAREVLDREFLVLRAKVLELAAAMDRLDRAAAGPAGPLGDDARIERLREALRVVLDADHGDRAERVQLIFSRSYDPQWRDTLGVSRGS